MYLSRICRAGQPHRVPRRSFPALLVPSRRRSVFQRLIALLILVGLSNMTAQAAMASVRDVRVLSVQAGLEGASNPQVATVVADARADSPSGSAQHGDGCPCECALPCALLQHVSALPAVVLPQTPRAEPPLYAPELAEASFSSASTEPATRPPIA